MICSVSEGGQGMDRKYSHIGGYTREERSRILDKLKKWFGVGSDYPVYPLDKYQDGYEEPILWIDKWVLGKDTVVVLTACLAEEGGKLLLATGPEEGIELSERPIEVTPYDLGPCDIAGMAKQYEGRHFLHELRCPDSLPNLFAVKLHGKDFQSKMRLSRPVPGKIWEKACRKAPAPKTFDEAVLMAGKQPARSVMAEMGSPAFHDYSRLIPANYVEDSYPWGEPGYHYADIWYKRSSSINGKELTQNRDIPAIELRKAEEKPKKVQRIEEKPHLAVTKQPDSIWDDQGRRTLF